MNFGNKAFFTANGREWTRITEPSQLGRETEKGDGSEGLESCPETSEHSRLFASIRGKKSEFLRPENLKKTNTQRLCI